MYNPVPQPIGRGEQALSNGLVVGSATVNTGGSRYQSTERYHLLLSMAAGLAVPITRGTLDESNQH